MEQSEHFNKIVSACASFRKNDFLCDTLLLVGDRQFKAHSVVLAAASSFFKSVYEQYERPEMYYIKLPGVDPELMPIILDYMYTGKLILPYKNDECKLPPSLFESFMTFGLDLSNHTEFVFDNQREETAAGGGEAGGGVEEGGVGEMKADVVMEEGVSAEEGIKVVDGNVVIVKVEEEEEEDDEVGKKLWICEECSRTFQRKGAYDRHMQIHAEEDKPTLCELCGVAVNGKAEMQNHLAVVHAKTFKNEWFNCHLCEKTFSKELTLMHHVNKVHKTGQRDSKEGRREFTCEFCDKQYASRTSIKLHTVMVHSKVKPYQCAECGRGFAFKSQMISHTRMHTGERPFECNTCGKTFSANLNLMQHIRIHTGERPFTCNYCGNRFSQRSHLQTHLRTHTGEKPYHCQQCEKKYKNRLDLRIHCLRIHNINIKLREPNIINNRPIKHR